MFRKLHDEGALLEETVTGCARKVVLQEPSLVRCDSHERQMTTHKARQHMAEEGSGYDRDQLLGLLSRHRTSSFTGTWASRCCSEHRQHWLHMLLPVPA
jgi:hypothetical protein